MNLSAIFSKTGKGVQEASGKTSHLSRADRSVLSAIDGKTSLSEVQKKFEKLAGPKFEALIQQLDKDGFIREVSSGAAQQPAAPVGRAAPPPRAAPPKAPAADSGDDSGLDFTQAIKVPPKAPAAPPKAPSLDLAAAARAEAERKAKEQEAFNYKARQEAEAKAQAEAKAREAAAHAKARAEAEANARAEAEAKARAETDAKVKAAREAAVRMATEANAKAGAADRERQAAEERARKEAEDKARLEAELNAKLAEERKAREEAERRASEAAERARRELEEKAKRDAEEMRQRLEAEMKAKLEEERKAREAEDRKRREEEDRKRREEDERRAKEEAERKAREEEDRKRREEDDRRRKADEERRAKEEAERRARREEEERRAKEEAERRKREEEGRRAKEESERRAKEESERRAKEEGERRAREEQDRKRRKEEDERREKEAAEAKSRAAQSEPAPPPPAAPPPAAGGDIGDSLLADLESFSRREEEESRAKEEAERKSKEEAARRARDEAERQAKEEAERKRREDEERRRKEDEERRAREETERQEREEAERAEQEEADRKRKAKDSVAAKKAEDKAARAAAAKGASRAGAAGDDDIGVTDEDLDMDDVKRDAKVLAKAEKKPEFEQGQSSAAAAARPVRRPVKWGKPAAIALFVLLIGGVGLLNVMPVSTSDYEKAASEAMGVPVKIGSARLAVLTGVEVRFENVSIGDGVKIRLVRGSPEVGSLFGGRKAFSRMELEGASISQDQLAAALLGKVAGENFRVERIVLKQAKFGGPLALPALDVEADIAGDGAIHSVTARGGDKLVVQLSPMGSDISFEISAGSLAMPFVPALTLSDFNWKGTANRGGVSKSLFDGRVYEGVVSGTAKIRWGGSWTVDGELKARGLKVAVFAPALVSEGKIEGKGSYAMSGSVPASLYESAKAQGDFKIEKGVLGSFNLTRALQTGGAQSTGRTEFSELTGQAVYDKGAIQIRNASLSAGAMNAGVSLDIDAGGGLAGRVAADVKTPTQTLRATLGISGKVSDPVVHK